VHLRPSRNSPEARDHFLPTVRANLPRRDRRCRGPLFRLAARHRRVPAPRCCPCDGKEGSASGIHDLVRDWHQFPPRSVKGLPERAARARSTEAIWCCAPLTAPMRRGGGEGKLMATIAYGALYLLALVAGACLTVFAAECLVRFIVFGI